MKLQFLGTAAAEGFPALFCQCENCKRARELGGRNIRSRSQALVDGKILCSSEKEEECLAAIGAEFADKSYLTVFYGESIDEERAQKAVAVLQEKVGSMTEIALLRGGQPIYDYIISAE